MTYGPVMPFNHDMVWITMSPEGGGEKRGGGGWGGDEGSKTGRKAGGNKCLKMSGSGS